MRFLQVSHRAVRLATIVAALALASPVANAQQPSAAAVATAREIVAVTGATTLFDPLIPGVIEQSKILFLQQNPALAKDLNEIAAKLRAELERMASDLMVEIRLVETSLEAKGRTR